MSLSRRNLLVNGLTFPAIGITPGQRGPGADDTRALKEAFDQALETGMPVTLEAGRSYTASDVLVPAGVALVVQPGASLRPLRPGSRFRLEGQIIGSGTHRLFASGWTFVKSAYPGEREDVPIEWFGAKASSGRKIDCSDAFDDAIAFCRATRSRRIILGFGYYYVSRTIRIDAPIGICGGGIQSSFLMGMMRGAVPVIELSGGRSAHVVDVDFNGFSIMSVEAGEATGLRAALFAHVGVSNVEFRNCAVGMDLRDTCYSWRVDGCKFLANRTHMLLGPESNNILLFHSQLIGGQAGMVFTGSCNSITVGGESNFEAIKGPPLCWRGQGTVVTRLSVTDSRFEKCSGAIGNAGGNAAARSFTFERNYVENSNGDTLTYFRLAGCDGVTVSRNYFERAEKGLVDAPPDVRQISVSENVLINIPQINLASRGGGLSAGEGYVRSSASGASGVRGSID